MSYTHYQVGANSGANSVGGASITPHSTNWNGREVSCLTDDEMQHLIGLFRNSESVCIRSDSRSHLFYYKMNEGEFAIKYYSPDRYKHSIEREGVIGPLLNHPNIAKIYGSVFVETDRYVIMDWSQEEQPCEFTLLNYFYITNCASSVYRSVCVEIPLDASELMRRWRNIQRLITQVQQAVTYLHANGYMHRDIHYENIRVRMKEGELVQATLFDLRCIRNFTTDDGLPPNDMDDDDSSCPSKRRYSFCGNRESRSPQMQREEAYSPKTDCYNLGELLMFLIEGVYPMKMPGFSTPQFPEWYPIQAKHLLIKLLSDEEENRPFIGEIGNDPFFTSDPPYFFVPAKFSMSEEELHTAISQNREQAMRWLASLDQFGELRALENQLDAMTS